MALAARVIRWVPGGCPMGQPADDAELEGLVASAAAGDELAWRALWNRLEPRLGNVLRRRTVVARNASPEEHVRDVVVAVMGRLREHGFQRLHQYLEVRRADPTLSFMTWLVVVARRVAVDVLRAHPDYVDRRRSAA